VVVRPCHEIEAHGLDVGGDVGRAAEPAGAGALEGPAVDDVALVVRGGDVGVANQLEHALESRIGIGALRIRDDRVADRGHREAVSDRGLELARRERRRRRRSRRAATLGECRNAERGDGQAERAGHCCDMQCAHVVSPVESESAQNSYATPNCSARGLVNAVPYPNVGPEA
jgi:hypothetical protein